MLLLFVISCFAPIPGGAASAANGAADNKTTPAQEPASGATATSSPSPLKNSDASPAVRSRHTGTQHGVPQGGPPAKTSGAVASRPAGTQETLSPHAEEIARIIKFDRQVLLLVKEATHERIQRLVGYDDEGYQIVAPGIAVTVPEEKSAALLAELRGKLRPLEYLAFIVEMNGLLRTDKIGVIKGSDPYEVIRIVRTHGGEYDITTDDIIERLKEWEKTAAFELIGADNDWIELEFSTLPADLKAFGEEVYEFSPDAVDEGPGSVEALIRELRKTRRLFLLWE